MKIDGEKVWGKINPLKIQFLNIFSTVLFIIEWKIEKKSSCERI